LFELLISFFNAWLICIKLSYIIVLCEVLER
jgi:hypothetical protein